VTAQVEFRPEAADLRAPAGVIGWLTSASDERPATPPEAEALHAAGVLGEDGLHPALRAAEEIVAGARLELRFERGDRAGRGWVGPVASVLGHPLPEGRARLVVVRTPLLVDALVMLNDVGPRPRVEPAIRIGLSPGSLAAALAARDPAQAGLDGAQAEAFAALVAGLREHWRVATRWEPAEGAIGGRELEVLDTDGGYWLVVPDGPTVELWPSTPTEVFRSLCRLFPMTAEVAEWPAS
jgi:hypothetical protein